MTVSRTGRLLAALRFVEFSDEIRAARNVRYSLNTDKWSGMSVDRSASAAALQEAEVGLAKLMPQATSLLFSRARALDALGRNEEAVQSYVEVLRMDPKHYDALTSLGALLVKTGHRAAAKTALERALHARPNHAGALANLANLLADDDPDTARQYYERALGLDPGHRGAHRGLAIVLLRMGEEAAARHHGRLGFQGSAEAWPYRGAGSPVSLLLVMSATGGNVPVEPFVDDRLFLRWTLAPEFFDPSVELPPHDVVFNAVGDADRCPAALHAAAAVLARSKAPVINLPSRVLETTRVANAERLNRIPGVATALTRAWPRDALAAPDGALAIVDQGFHWPILLRAPGFHTGEHFVKVDGPAGLQEAVASLPGSTLLVLQFVDTRGSDGMFRKFRVMTVDGQLYPLHLAVSAHWKVHYFSADMADRADHRAEDEAFLKDMVGVLGPSVLRTLEAVRDCLGLDYGGIDFAVDGNGRVVVFEANATMVIVRPSDDTRWAYRMGPVERVKHAVQRMLASRAGAPRPMSA